jgi:ketosteroid isomerase-like protein
MTTFLLAAVSIVVLMGCTAVLAESGQVPEIETEDQPPFITNMPQRRVKLPVYPEPTMGEIMGRYIENRDNDPIATSPESTRGEGVAANTGWEDQIEAASEAWDTAFNAENIDQLMALYAEDAVSMPSGFPALEGKEAIRNDFEYIFAEFNYEHETEIVGLLISGNVAVERGQYTLVDTDTGETIEAGKHIVVRQKSGNAWKVVWEIWNTNE